MNVLLHSDYSNLCTRDEFDKTTCATSSVSKGTASTGSGSFLQSDLDTSLGSKFDFIDQGATKSPCANDLS